MFGPIKRLFGVSPPAMERRERVHVGSRTWPAVIYAIGDVHGCLAELRALERKIVEDASAINGDKWIICLGDYIDRGPDSAGVLDALMAPPPAGFRRICLAGNHELMALDFLHEPRPRADWLAFGGQETLASYGVSLAAIQAGNTRSRQALLDSHIPAEHIEFMKELAISVSVPGYLFVHAGIRPGIALEHQSENDLLWIRGEFLDAPPTPGLRVVHGHTPNPDPVLNDARICVDTGAFATGILTAVRLTEHEEPRFLSTAS